jgi:hypothetical protein
MSRHRLPRLASPVSANSGREQMQQKQLRNPDLLDHLVGEREQ